MKAIIVVPADLYRKVKARSALEGCAIREVTIELYRRWLEEPESPEALPVSAYEMMKEFCGEFGFGVRDLGSDSKHLEGFSS